MNNYSLKSPIFFFLAVVGCSTVPPNEKGVQKDSNYKEQMGVHEEQKDISQEHDSDEKRIEAARLASSEKDFKAVARILSTVKNLQKNSYVKSNFLLIEAEKAIYLKKPALAVKILESVTEEDTLSSDDRITISNLKADAHYLEKNFFSHAKELIALSPALKESRRKSNQDKIFRSLMMLGEKKLEKLLEGQLSFEERGWILLALVARADDENLEKQVFAFEEWKKNWAAHPAITSPPERLINLPEMIRQTPKTVALILPLSEDYSKFGEAIRDGFIAAHYQSKEKKRIMVYDSNSSDITDLIEKAFRDDADLIVGPLNRKKVATLAKSRLPVKTLALNRAEGYGQQTNLFQFGLAPEDESEQVARKAYEAGYRRALVIAPETEWGDRNQKAFTQAFNRLGGKTLESARFSSQKDYSNLVRKLFKIGTSEDRASKLSRIIGNKLEFKARRRKDVDFIFLLASNSQARGIKPTISFFYGEDLPVYATSHINRYSENKLNNIDLNGIHFCEMPWNLENQNKVQATITEIRKEESKELAPFFALGADAHKIAQRLEQMETHPHDPIFGSTGLLRMNSNHQIRRILAWAKYEDSSVKLEEPTIDLR